MNDIEKAIEEFKKLKYVSKDLKVEHIELAISALEKQISQKVIGREFCPNCKKYLNVEGAEQECCDNCGQKLDWSEVQE